MMLKNIPMDVIVFVCAIRAAGYCKPWEYTIQLLDKSYELFSNNSLQVANTAMINLKYIEDVSRVKNVVFKSVIQKCEDILQWIVKNNIRPTEQTMVTYYYYYYYYYYRRIRF